MFHETIHDVRKKKSNVRRVKQHLLLERGFLFIVLFYGRPYTFRKGGCIRSTFNTVSYLACRMVR